MIAVLSLLAVVSAERHVSVGRDHACLVQAADGAITCSGEADAIDKRASFAGPFHGVAAGGNMTSPWYGGASSSNSVRLAFIMGGVLNLTSGAPSSTLYPITVESAYTTDGAWRAVAVDSDGTTIFASRADGLVRSTDSGASWQTLRSGPWTAVAMSLDGRFMLAAEEVGCVWGSNDLAPAGRSQRQLPLPLCGQPCPSHGMAALQQLLSLAERSLPGS